MSWYQQPASGEERGFVVVEAKIGASRAEKALPAWKQKVFSRVSVLVSVALAATMEALKRALTVTMIRADELETAVLADPWEPKGQWFVDAVRLQFMVDAEGAERIRVLLAQPEKPYGYTNAYRFVRISDTPTSHGRFVVQAEIARGEWKDRKGKDGVVRVHGLSVIESTTGLQRMLTSYLKPIELEAVPRALRDGVAQEAAQQMTSYIGQLESAKVKGDTAYPTVEDREPVRRRTAFETAVDHLRCDVRPLQYAKARDLDPGAYAEDDKRGNRLVANDERWLAVVRSPDPRPIPLFFVDGGQVRLDRLETVFDAGVSKVNRHRGRLEPSEQVRSSRPQAVQKKGFTCLRSIYALLPLLDSDDADLRAILTDRDAGLNETSAGRLAKHERMSVPLQDGPAKVRKHDVRVPLSFDAARFGKILNRGDLEIAWAKVVCSQGEWYLQLTVRVPFAKPVGVRKVLGVTFGLDAIASWCLTGEDGKVIETGSIAPNPQIVRYLNDKLTVEWDQAKERWVGGTRFAPALEHITHQVSNKLVELANSFGAVLAVHDVQWVKKSGKDGTLNRLFTAWNYGQLRRYLEYKSPLAGLGVPAWCGDYLVNMTCPVCGAIRGKNETPEKAKTWRTNGTLHCRACGYEGTVTGAENAHRVASHGLSVWKKAWAKEA